MKSKLLMVLATSLGITANAQKQTFEAKDGTKVDVEILSVNPDEGRHASIYVGMFGPEGVNLVGASYYKPTSFYLSAMAGPMGGMADGSFFFHSRLKDSKSRQSVKTAYSGGTITKYVISVPDERRKSIGVHAGANLIDYSAFSVNQGNTFSATGIFGGITFLASKFSHWQIDDDYKEAQGSTVGRLNADVIYYANRKLVLSKDGSDDTTLDEMSRKVGFRVYFDGKTSAWSRKGRIAVHYMLGVGKNSDRAAQLPLFGGLGFGYNFL